MARFWEDSFLLKRLEREYKILDAIVREYNLIPKDEAHQNKRKEKIKQLKEQYYRIKEMEEGWR